MAKWIEFIEGTPKAKTKCWLVVAKDGGTIGSVKWHGPWRKYCFFPYDYTVFEEDCLRDISNFIEGETAKHRSQKV